VGIDRHSKQTEQAATRAASQDRTRVTNERRIAVGIFGKSKPNAGKIHATKAGRFLADIEREQKAKKQNDEVAQQRAKKQGGGKK
jgi:hypothetical protein